MFYENQLKMSRNYIIIVTNKERDFMASGIYAEASEKLQEEVHGL